MKLASIIGALVIGLVAVSQGQLVLDVANNRATFSGVTVSSNLNVLGTMSVTNPIISRAVGAPSDMLLWYPFNAPWTDGLIHSYGNTEVTGTPVVGKSVYTNGYYSKGMNFSTAAQNIINFGNPAALNDLTQFTFSAWVYPVAVNSREHSIIGKNWNKASFDFYLSTDGGGRLEILLQKVGGSLCELSKMITSNLNGSWNFVAATWDNSVVNLYINGVLSASSNFAGGALTNVLDCLTIGGVGNGGAYNASYTFNGTIDDVKAWTRALSSNEILALYNSPGEIPSPDAWAGNSTRPTIIPTCSVAPVPVKGGFYIDANGQFYKCTNGLTWVAF